MVERDAFIIVIGEIEGDKLRGLVQRQQAFHATRNRSAVGRMQMQHAAGILADFVNRRIDREAGLALRQVRNKAVALRGSHAA